MIFDTSFVTSSGSPSEICRLAAKAEKLGFNAVWMAHDLLWDNAWVICGAIANSTRRINIGPGIVNPYSCSLPEIAMGAASLDILSGGRCVLGIGPGAKHMLLNGNISQTQTIKTLDEAIHYLKDALRPDSKRLKMELRREIPIYIGCQSPKMLEHIGRWDVGGLPLLTPPSYAGKALKLMRKGAQDEGVPLRKKDFVASLLVAVGTDENEAMRAFAPFIISILRHLSPHQLKTAEITQQEIPDIMTRYEEKGWEGVPSKVYSLGAIGVERCIDAIEEVEDAGFIRTKLGGILGSNKELAMDVLADKVMPHFA